MQELTLLHGEGFACPTLLCCSSLLQSDPTISFHHLSTITSTSRYHLISITRTISAYLLSIPSHRVPSQCHLSKPPSLSAIWALYHPSRPASARKRMRSCLRQTRSSQTESHWRPPSPRSRFTRPTSSAHVPPLIPESLYVHALAYLHTHTHCRSRALSEPPKWAASSLEVQLRCSLAACVYLCACKMAGSTGIQNGRCAHVEHSSPVHACTRAHRRWREALEPSRCATSSLGP